MDLENEEINKSQKTNDKFGKHKRVTKSGRITKTPKKLITSSDEAPPRKRPSKTSVSVKKELARLQGIAMAIKSKQTEKCTSKRVVQANNLKVASNNLVETPVDNSTLLPPTNASEMTGNTATEIISPPVSKLDLNADATVLPNKSHTGKTIACLPTPAANVTATSMTHVSTKANSRFGNAASSSRNENFNFPEWSDYTGTIAEGTTDDLRQTLSSSQRTLKLANHVETLVDNSTFVLPINASEVAGQAEMDIMILPVHDFDSNADPITLLSKSHTRKTTATLPTPAANVKATSVTQVSTKANSTSWFGEVASTPSNENFNFQEWSDHTRIIPERTTGDLEKILKTLQSIEKQNTEIIQKQTEMKQQIDRIQEHLTEKNVGEAQLTETLYEPLKGFPLTTVEQFREMENTEQKNTRKKVYEHVLKLGGTKPRDFLHCALKEVVTDKLVCEFSWRGDKTSEKFGNTKISNTLFRAAKSCSLFKGPETKSEFKKEIQEILRCTKQRYRNQLRKMKVPETEEADVDVEHNAVVEEIERLRQLHQEENSSDADSEEEDESSDETS